MFGLAPYLLLDARDPYGYAHAEPKHADPKLSKTRAEVGATEAGSTCSSKSTSLAPKFVLIAKDHNRHSVFASDDALIARKQFQAAKGYIWEWLFYDFWRDPKRTFWFHWNVVEVKRAAPPGVSSPSSSSYSSSPSDATATVATPDVEDVATTKFVKMNKNGSLVDVEVEFEEVDTEAIAKAKSKSGVIEKWVPHPSGRDFYLVPSV